MKPHQYQLDFAEEAFEILKNNMIVYLAMEERTRKTLISLLVCERAKVQNILVLTKKKALDGWHEHLEKFSHTKNYTITNYHQAKKFKASDYDLVILDEAHNYISSFPKVSAIWRHVKELTRGKPIIYLSATPNAQGEQMLYHQFALSDWSPFRKWSSAYRWFDTFGIPTTTWLYQKEVPVYTNVCSDEIRLYVDHLFITATRKDLGFKHEPLDNIHYIELNPTTKQVYNMILKHKVVEINGHLLVCDTSSRLRAVLHMLEGGVTIAKTKIGTTRVNGKTVPKYKNTYMIFGNTEKVDYIKERWGDTSELVIMYQYKAEKLKLEQHFKNASILQATSFAEGVDLSHKRHLVIYSQDFSTARHAQRRARQASKSREDSIVVHFLLVKKAISDQVYQTVSINKKNFVDSVFERTEL